jgi:hypothetical protein
MLFRRAPRLTSGFQTPLNLHSLQEDEGLMISLLGRTSKPCNSISAIATWKSALPVVMLHMDVAEPVSERVCHRQVCAWERAVVIIPALNKKRFGAIDRMKLAPELSAIVLIAQMRFVIFGVVGS